MENDIFTVTIFILQALYGRQWLYLSQIYSILDSSEYRELNDEEEFDFSNAYGMYYFGF